MNNYFILTVAILQFLGGSLSFFKGQTWFGVLYLLYGLTNVVLWRMQL